MQKWEYKTVVAPNWTVSELLGEVVPGEMRSNLFDLDLNSETDIVVKLDNLGLEGWELSATASVEPVGGQPSPDLLLIFKRPKD